MSYYNRRRLFYNTLKTIEQSKYKDLVEIIAVDDASNDNNRIDDFPNLFKLDIKVIRIEKKDKWYVSTSIPFNMGIKESKNDIIILQNAECLHFGDILEYVFNNIKENVYLSFGAYSIDEYNTDKINKINFDNLNVKNEIEKIITPLKNGRLLADGVNAWYNHSVWRPLALHFCNAITKKDLDDLGGFDERFAHGFAFEDSELIWRIKEVKKMDVRIIDSPFVIHQYHEPSNYKEKQQYYIRNALLYEQIKKEKNYKVNK